MQFMWILTTVSYALYAECVLYSIWCLSVSLFFCPPASKMCNLFMCTMARKVKWKQKAVALQQCKVQSWYENDSVSAWTASLEYAHGFTAKKKRMLPWPWVCISSVVLTPVYGLRNVGCASYVSSKCGLCFTWNKCADTSLHTEAYCSKNFQGDTRFYKLLGASIKHRNAENFIFSLL